MWCTLWTKVYEQQLVHPLIPKPKVLRWGWLAQCCYNSLYCSGGLAVRWWNIAGGIFWPSDWALMLGNLDPFFCQLVSPPTFQLNLLPDVFTLTITSLHSSKAEMRRTDYFGKTVSCDGATGKVTKLFCTATHSAANVCCRSLHYCVLNYTPMSAVAVTYLGNPPNQQGRPHIFAI